MRLLYSTLSCYCFKREIKKIMEIRDKVFSLRLTQIEYQYLKEKAKKNGQTVAGLIRLLMDNYREVNNNNG